jgi:eukaryotic-like serine/threonine-protein kinase
VQPAAADSLIGYVLADKYRVLRQIGKGGMGVVYEAEHVELGKRVAIKLMLEKYADDAEAIRRFQREAYAASRIGNPHIIDVSDIGRAPDGRAFVVMELLHGLPLSQLLQQTGPMQWPRAVEIMRQVLRAVGAAHAKGIIHRDLKPDNIFLIQTDDRRDFIKLLDFGISKVTDPEEQIAFTKLTSTGVVMGTPLYMSPEQAMGNPTDRMTDIYACGVILYEMLAGRPPFEGATYAVLVSKLLTSPPPALETVRGGLPRALVKAVHRALEKEPPARFSTAELFAASLPGDRSPSQIELAGTLDSGFAHATAAPTTRRSGRNVAIAAVAFTLAAAGTAAVLVMTKDQQPSPAAAAAPAPTTPPRPEAAPAPAPEPVAITGTLEVKSMPSGAAVLVDNRPAGTTPVVITLGVGRHSVKLELGGHSAIETEEEVRAGERTSVVVPMQKGSSKIKRPDTKATAKGGRPVPGIRTNPTSPVSGPIEPTVDRTVGKPQPPTLEEPTRPKSDDEPKPKSGAGTKPNPY